ncbi:MAG TPA: SIR2 family protein [Candidatus Sulfotelmatobacter sp.]|nr:SIR2 family protein [Candidatus Sulfotelmatobacter sp.]
MTVVFAGAGASAVGRAARLAVDLLRLAPEYDGGRRRHARELHVIEAWNERQAIGPVALEAWFSELQASDDPRDLALFHDLAALIAHNLAQDMAHTRNYRTQFTTLTKIAGSTQVPDQENLWTTLGAIPHLAVVTTNYDIIIERGLRFKPTRRSPGFHYGIVGERLEGALFRGHGQDTSTSGRVPLYKLHGSLSWSLAPGGRIMRYVDCRPAITGRAFIVPPVREKPVAPRGLEHVWSGAASVLAAARRLIVIGYSAPEYDWAVRDLLARHLTSTARVDVFNLYPEEAETYRRLLPGRTVEFHGPLPAGLPVLRELACA